MKRFAVLLVLLSACGGGHLGKDYGKRVRAAQAAQADGKGDSIRYDGDDAKQTLSAQRKAPEGDKGGGGGAIVVPNLGGGGGGGYSSSKGGGDAIQLEGIR
jgi:hypothetical protein